MGVGHANSDEIPAAVGADPRNDAARARMTSAQPPPLADGDPRQVGRFTILGLLGEGGMGRVFLGRSPGDRAVAIKVIRAGLASDPAFRARFSREIAAARAVSGFYTAPVVDADAARATARATAVDEIGDLTKRELVIAGAIAYWCEGSKNKPGPWNEHVAFTNSDPSLIRFFLRFLEATGTPREDVTFRIYIHQSADVESAQRFWLEATGARPDRFSTPTLKRHNPKTVRKNVGEGYYGCLRIDVRRSSSLYRKIEGWAAAIMSGNC